MVPVLPMTDRARRVLELAEEFASARSDAAVGAEHLLYGLAAEEDGLAAQLLKSHGVDARTIDDRLRRLGEVAPSVDAPDLAQLQVWARNELAPLGHNYVGTEHLLLALTQVGDNRFRELLQVLHLAASVIRREVREVLGYFA